MAELSPEALLEQASQHFLDGHYDEALKEFDQVLAMVPPDQHHIVHANRGATMMSVGDVEGAVQAFDEALKVDPNHVEALYNKGVALNELQRLDEALVCFEKVTAQSPDFYAGQRGKSETLAALGRLDDAVKAADAAIALEPDTATAYADKGFALLKLKKFSESCGAYENAVRCGDDTAETKRLYSIVLAQHALDVEERGDKAKAVEYLTKSCELLPVAQNFHNCGIILLSLGDTPKAISKFQSAVETDDNYFESHAALGVLFAQADQLDKSCLHLERACLLDAKSIESRYNLGVIRIKKGDVEGARKEWLTVLQIEPGEPHATEALRILDAALAEAKSRGTDGSIETKAAAKKISDISAATASSSAAPAQQAARDHSGSHARLEMGPDGKPRGMTATEADALISTLDRLDQALAASAPPPSAAPSARRKSVLDQKAPTLAQPEDRSYVLDVAAGATTLRKAQPRDNFGALEAKLTSTLNRLGVDDSTSGDRRKSYTMGSRAPGTILPEKPKIEYKKPGETVFPYAELKNKFPTGVDPSNKEQYLSDEEFQKVFGKTKKDFLAFPAWKKAREKKRLGLF